MERNTIEYIHKFLSENNLDLQSSQAKLCLPIIDRISRKMMSGIFFSPIKVDGNLICDGHHRYIASVLVNVKIGRIPSVATSGTMRLDWKQVTFVEEDWDTLAKINMLNEQDAKFNCMTIAELSELLK